MGIRDVAIPEALQDAMSRQAQIEFVEAADIYAGHPAALQLRAMNIIYETTKERGADPDADFDGRQRESFCHDPGACARG